MTQTTRAYLMLVTVAILWGTQPMFIKLGLPYMTAVTLVAFRHGIICLVLLTLQLLRHNRIMPDKKTLFLLVFSGLFGVVLNNILEFDGLHYTTVTNSVLLSTFIPVMTAILSFFLLKERLGTIQWAGLAVSVFGVILLITGGSIDVLHGLSFNRGDMELLLGKFFWAAYCLLNAVVLRKVSTINLVIWSGLFGTMMTVTYGLSTGELRMPEFNTDSLLAIAYVSLGGGVFGLLFWNAGIGIVGPSKGTIFSSLQPLVGTFCGVIFLSEPFTVVTAFSGIAIILGVALVTHSPWLFHHLPHRPHRI